MATVNVGLMALPNPTYIVSIINNYAFNAANEKRALICQAPKDGDIDRIRFYVGGITTGATMRIRIETVSTTTGDPSGSLVNAGAEGTVVVADTDDQTWKNVDLGTPATVSEGDYLAIVLEVAAGVPNTLNIRGSAGMDYNIHNHLPYIDVYNGATWTKGNAYAFAFLPRYSGETDYSNFPFACTAQRTNINIRTGLDPLAGGNRFKLPFSVRATGGWAVIGGNAVPTHTLKLAKDDGTLLASSTYDGNVRAANSANPTSHKFDTSVTLEPETYYRIYVEAGTATSDPLYYAPYERTAYPELDDWQGQQMTSLGVWSNIASSTDSIASVGIWVDQITVSTPFAYGFG